MANDWKARAASFDWEGMKSFLQKRRQQPMFDRAFNRLLTHEMGDSFGFDDHLNEKFLSAFDAWIHGGELNEVGGLSAFPYRDLISGVTNFLDDLHIHFGERIVCMEGEYAYHRRIKPDIPHRNLETLQRGDVLIFAVPFALFGDLHPQTAEILNRCLELDIPVHVDAAWFGCMKGFSFDYDHPAIRSVGFSLSKGLGLGAHRCGVRYCRSQPPGAISVINDFNMVIRSPFACGLKFINEFGSDYLQNKYSEAYQFVCDKYGLRPTKAIHIAIQQDGETEWPVGLRPFLRYLVEDRDEFKTSERAVT